MFICLKVKYSLPLYKFSVLVHGIFHVRQKDRKEHKDYKYKITIYAEIKFENL